MQGHHLRGGAAALVVPAVEGGAVEELVEFGRLPRFLARRRQRQHEFAAELAAGGHQFL